MRKVKPNMRDVAEAANVSATTVWMVIHNKPGIPPETADKVWETISQIGYVVKTTEPDKASSPEAGEAIALLIEQNSIPAISDVFYGDVIRGFQAEADKQGYHVVLSMFDRQQPDFDMFSTGLAQKISGMVIANDGDISHDIVSQIKMLNVPVVLIESYMDSHELPCVLGDNFLAGYKVTRYILELGHKRIAILKGPVKYSSLVDRLRGCLAALTEAGLTVPELWMPEPVSGHPLKGYVQMREILAQDELPTAVIAISDKTAFGAMEALREAGLRIPQDISIASMDNTYESSYTRPPLTTVHIPKYEIGVLAMQKLNRLITQEDTIMTKTLVYSELIVRESAAPIG